MEIGNKFNTNRAIELKTKTENDKYEKVFLRKMLKISDELKMMRHSLLRTKI